MSSIVITKELTNSRIEKKKVFAVCVNVLQRTSIKIRGSWRITTQLKKFLCNNQFYWNEMKFLSPWKLRLIFKSSIWSILSTSLMVSLGVQLNCLFSLPEMIAFSFPRIICFNFLQMKLRIVKADAFSQRQQFPYFRNSLLKLGQSCERHLNFYKRKEGQVNLIVNSLSFSA